MLTMNKATLLGYAGRNPEMRKLPSGDDVAQFSLATTERFRRKDDTVAESTEWHTIVAFGPAAEAVRKLVRKGVPVLVEGRIVTRSWIDRTTGAERRATEIVVAGRRSLVNVLSRPGRGTGGIGAGGEHGGGTAVSAGERPRESAGSTGAAGEPAGEVDGEAGQQTGNVNGETGDRADEARGSAGTSAGEPTGKAATPPDEAGGTAGEMAGGDGGEAVEAADADGPSDDHGEPDDGGPSDDRE